MFKKSIPVALAVLFVFMAFTILQAAPLARPFVTSTKEGNVVGHRLGTSGPNLAGAREPPPRTVKEAIAGSGDKIWNLVVLGDSLLHGFPERYADLLEAKLRIKIVAKSYKVGTSQEMLQLLRHSQPLRQDLSVAHVIFFHIPRHWFGTFYSWPETIEADTLDSLKASLLKALQAYEADAKAIIAEIVSLRSPFDAFIRTMDAIGDWNVEEAKRIGIQALLHQYWSAANETLTNLAVSAKIPVAKVYAVFNGISGNEDPIAKGYMQATRVTLCTELGIGQLVRAVDELGLGYGLYYIT